MKTKYIVLSGAALVLGTLDPQLAAVFAQGSLTPPGPPELTMKSLDQIEARTPIFSVPFAITNPGSYYLTTNLTVTLGDAITIATNGVTLDLNGFTISSTAANANGTAILLDNGTTVAPSDTRIINGHISSGVTNDNGVFNGGGFVSGIDIVSNATVGAANALVRDVTVTGCLNNGIFLAGNGSLIDGCSVQVAGNIGLLAYNVTSSQAFYCGSYGVRGFVLRGCLGHVNVPGGEAIYSLSIAEDCWGESDAAGGTGVFASGQAVNCTGNCFAGGGGNGIYANLFINCSGYASAGSTALHGTIGVASEWNGSGTPETITYKYNMP